MKTMAPGLYPVSIAFCVSRREFDREMKDRKIEFPFPEDEGCVVNLELEDGTLLLIVVFNESFKKCSLVDKLGLVVHETTHVWQHIRRFIEEPAAGDEIEAYTQQWISEWLLTQLQKIRWIK